MKNIYSIILVFLFLPSILFAQTELQHKKDSLLKLVITSEGKQKLDKYYHYADLFFKEARDSASANAAVSVYNDYFKEAERQNNLNEQATAKSNIIGIYHNLGMFDKVFRQAPQVMEMCKKAGNYNLYYYVYQLYVLDLLVTNQFAKGVSEIQKAYDEAKILNNNEGILFAINAFATSYNAQKNKAEAMKYMKEGIDFAKKNKFTNQTLVRLYYHYGQELLLESRFDEFLSMYDEFEKALYEHEKIKNNIGKSILQYFRWVLKGQYYVKIKNNEQAKICCDSLNPYMTLPAVKTMVDQIQAEIYENSGQFSKAVDKLDELMLFYSESDMFYVGMKLVKARLLAKMGKAMESYETIYAAYLKNDSLQNVQRLKMMDELNTQYEVDKHIAEKERNRNYFLFALAGCMLLVIALGIWIYYSRKISNKNRTLVSQIKELQEQHEKAEAELLSRTTFKIENDDDNLCPESRKDELCITIRDIILKDKAYRDPTLTRDLLVERLGTNKNTFIEAFQFCFGISFPEFINNLRLKDAITLLEKSDLSMDEISQKVGFGSLRTFQRQFQNKYNMTPKEYRKALIK